MNNSLMVYGANGYSAGLILKKLIDKNIIPVLAGRNQQAISGTAKKYNCEYRVMFLSISFLSISPAE